MSEEQKRPAPGTDDQRLSDVEHYRPRQRYRPAGDSFAIPWVSAEITRMLREQPTSLSLEQRAKIVEKAGRRLAELQSKEPRRVAETPDGNDAGEDLSAGAEALETAICSVPPRIGEALVGLLCKRDMREAVLGDLDEKFAELAERRGARIARAWYWSQAGRSVLFFALRGGRRLLELGAILKRIV